MPKKFLSILAIVVVTGGAATFGAYRIYANYLDAHKEEFTNYTPETSDGEVL